MKNKLQKLGFSKNLSTVYLALVELKKARAGELIQHTGLHRSIIYTSLDELVSRELVTKRMIKGIAVFSMNAPENLVGEIEKRKAIAEEIASELKKQQTEEPREIMVYEGIEGIIRATDKNLTYGAGSEIYILGVTKAGVSPILDTHWQTKYHKRRIKKGIVAKILYDRTVPIEVLQQRNAMPLAEARYLPFEHQMPAWFNISGDRMFMAVADSEDPIVFSVRSQEVADGFKKYFEYLWEQAEPVK